MNPDGRVLAHLSTGTDDRPAVAETHSGVVFFLRDRAYKVKKALDLGFLDFRTREARQVACHREVELNRRLAPDVYEGVTDVFAPDGTLCEHLVVMRRMPAERRLASLVAGHVAVEDELWDIARSIAGLHERSPRSAAADEAAGVDATRLRWDANTEALIGMNGRIFDDSTVGLVHGLACRYLDGRGPLFAARVADGRGVDGHGDLLADDIFCLDDGPRILDCIEFDDRLRLGDGLADVAFLAMDLEHLGRPDLAQHFLQAYAEQRGDVWPSSLAHHQIAYRAQVRAKVTAQRAEQGDEAAPPKAVALLNLALRHLERGRVRLVLVGGLPGTGKSTLAGSLGSRLGCTVLRSDQIRKELAGLPGRARAAAEPGGGIYNPAATTATYETMLDRARVALGMGETVILDASWTDRAWRTRARELGRATASDVLELQCSAPMELAAARLERRAEIGVDPSDATASIAADMARTAHAWPEAITIDTSGSPSSSLAYALRYGHLTP